MVSPLTVAPFFGDVTSRTALPSEEFPPPVSAEKLRESAIVPK
jgi:hypothetical protein